MPKVKITVQAPAEHPEVLDIRDAMHQVLDFFDTLSGDDDTDTLAWKITYAGTNSPFTAEAEAVSVESGVDITPIANSRISETARYFAALSLGERSSTTLSKRRRAAARQIFRRNLKAVGKTSVSFSGPAVPEVILTPEIARTSLATAGANGFSEIEYLVEDRARKEYGSVEGKIVGVISDYNHPAIQIEERKSRREIKCRVEQDVIDAIADATSLKDVWEHRRVRVRGLISYDASGQISRVYAKAITPVMPRTMTIKDIEDKDFTDGLSTETYLDKLREGELG